MKKLIIFIIILHSLTNEMNASHIMGADISYKLIDTAVGKYRFRVTLYRDCSGIQFGGEQLQIRKTAVSTSIPLNFISSEDVTPLCKVPDVPVLATTNCPSGPIGSNGIKGVERHIYEVDYVVGKNIGFAYFAWTSCCRNGSINTIAGASAANMWVQCLINTNIQNNSTTFTSPPIPYWCRLKQNTYNHGSVDSFDVKYTQINGINVERDSLVYELYAPFTAEAANTNTAANLQNPTVTYNTPLNKTNFLYTTTGVSFDPLTGHLSFTPSIAQDAVIAVAVKEYRAVPNASGNGYTRVLAGYVTRDIQVTVRDICDDIIMPGVIADSLVNANYENSSSVNLKAYSKNNIIKFKIVGAPTQFIKSKVIVTPSTNLFTGFNYSQNIVRANNTDTLIGSISIDSVNTIGSDKFIIQVYYCSSIGMKHSQFYTLKINSYGIPTCSQFKNISFTKNGNVYQFNSSGPSSVPLPYTVSYNWTFSNGSTSTQKNPLITLPTSNSNWAKLKVCIDSGTTSICCDSSMRDSINSCLLTCNLMKVGGNFTVLKFNGTPPYTYNWGAGYINDSFILNPSPGNYTVTVKDANGCTSTCSNIVYSPCLSYKNFNFSYSGNTMNYTTNIPSNLFPTFYWSFGDSIYSSLANPSHTYSSYGYKTVKLKYCLRDSSLNVICCDSITRLIIIYPPCSINANFGWASTSNGGTYQFIDSTTPIGTNYTYQWDFGDSTFSTQRFPVKTYTTNGTRTICLIVTQWANFSNQICRDTICKTINVTNVNPCNRFVPDFNWSTSGGAYQFNNTTNINGFNIVSVSFNISTGASYNYNNPVHTFINNGYYSVTMTMTVFDATTGTNCTKSITKAIYVNTSVCGCLRSNFTHTQIGSTVNFNNISTCIDTNTTYLYKFGNGATTTLKNPTYTYPLPGLYRVVLIVTKTVGSTTCVDSSVRFIQIRGTNPCKDSGYISSQVCSDYVSPVCGCDSVTYKNYCEGSKKGVKQYYTGPCPNDTNYVKICGYVYNDFNKNCMYDTTDVRLSGIAIKFNTTPIRYAYTNYQGYYSIYLPKGTYLLTQVTNNSNYNCNNVSQLCPASNGNITVAATTGGMTYCNNNFYDTVNTCPDLSVSIFKQNRITPGFISRKGIIYQNKSITPIPNAVLKYRFLGSLNPLSTSSPIYTVSGNIMTWNLGTIPALSAGYKFAHFLTPISLPLGTSVIDSVWIEPLSGDYMPNNNSATYNDTCVGSYDPNDKSAYPANDIEPEVKQLDYLVRFQNTGTAPAHNVLIEDQIDANFDRSSLDIKASSHAMTHHYDDAGKLFFEFANIMLPDSGTDYEASQGYVAYSLKLKDGLSIGTQLKNTAHIFFDFNEAVITNTTVNTIVLKSTTGVQNQGKDMNISIFPNPTADRATIFIKLDKASQVSYSLYDLQGKLIFQNGTDKSYTGEFNQDLSLEGLTKGIYLLNITVNGKESSFKLLKE